MKITVRTNECGGSYVFTSKGHAQSLPTTKEAIDYGRGYQRGYQEAINRLGDSTTISIDGVEQ